MHQVLHRQCRINPRAKFHHGVLSVELLKVARDHGRIAVAEVARITDASRHTIMDHLKALVGVVTLFD